MIQHTKTGTNVPNDHKYPSNIPNGNKIYQKLPFQGFLKKPELGFLVYFGIIFIPKIYHLATLFNICNSARDQPQELAMIKCCQVIDQIQRVCPLKRERDGSSKQSKEFSSETIGRAAVRAKTIERSVAQKNRRVGPGRASKMRARGGLRLYTAGSGFCLVWNDLVCRLGVWTVGLA
jgi:hypothetical protein